MGKRINVYLSNKDIELLGDISGKDLIDLAKKGIDIYKIDKIYDEIVKIGEKIIGSSGGYPFGVPNSATVQGVKKVNSYVNDAISKLEPIEKKSMSMVYGKQRDKFKLARGQGGGDDGSGWVDFDELMNNKIFISIQSALDSGEYIED